MKIRWLLAVLLASFLAAGATPANARGPASKSERVKVCDTWMANSRALIPVKENGARTLAAMRDTACAHKSKSIKAKCVSRYKDLIDRREKEKRWLESMLKKASALPRGQCFSLSASNDAFIHFSNETDARYWSVVKDFPPHLPSTTGQGK